MVCLKLNFLVLFAAPSRSDHVKAERAPSDPLHHPEPADVVKMVLENILRMNSHRRC